MGRAGERKEVRGVREKVLIEKKKIYKIYEIYSLHLI